MTDPKEDRILRTSALQALAASGDSARALTVALRGVGDYDPLYAVAAVGVVGQIGGPSGKDKLQAALKTETRVTVRAAMVRATTAH